MDNFNLTKVMALRTSSPLALFPQESNFQYNLRIAKNIVYCISSYPGGSNITAGKLLAFIMDTLKNHGEKIKETDIIQGWHLVHECGSLFYTTKSDFFRSQVDPTLPMTPNQLAQSIIEKVKKHFNRKDNSLEITENELAETMVFFGGCGSGPFKKIFNCR